MQTLTTMTSIAAKFTYIIRLGKSLLPLYFPYSTRIFLLKFIAKDGKLEEDENLPLVK
jgi:hypothetical protein